jgi:nucleotide-binding universal stress UspA family protein
MTKHLYIVGIDGSECSERAAERAINLADKSGDRVKLIYVLNWVGVQPMMYEGIAPPMRTKEEEEARIENNVIKPLLKKYNQLNVQLDSELLWGEPAEILLNKVKNEHANMLFVGRRGRSPLIDALLGSVANKLAHRVGIPIVLVP